MSNGSWSGPGNMEVATNKTIVAALHKYIVKYCTNQQYQMSEATWRNFCLKVADSLCTDSSNEVYDSNKIINYIYNANDACNIDHRVSYIVNDSSTPSSPNNNLSSFTSTTPKVCIFCLKYFLSKYSFIFSSTELCTQEPSYLVRSKVHLSICKDYLGKDGCDNVDCSELHCCKYFLLDTCKFGDNCSFGHNLLTPHNKEILQSNFIFLDEDEELNKKNNNTPLKNHFNKTSATSSNNSNNLSPISNNDNSNTTTLKTTTTPSNSKLRKQINYLAHYSIGDLGLLLQRDCPRICRFFNSELGCKYGPEGKKCPALHICRQLVMAGQCASEQCLLNHTVHSPQVSGLLGRQGLSINEFTKEATILEHLKSSEEAAETLNQPPNQPLNHSIAQSINATSLFTPADSTLMANAYNSPTHDLISNGLYDNSLTTHFDNPYDGSLMTQGGYFEGEEMVENGDGAIYTDMYNNHDSLYNNHSFNNNDELTDDCYLPVYYPNNYQLSSTKTDKTYYLASTKENTNYFLPSYSKDSTSSSSYYQTPSAPSSQTAALPTKQASFYKAPMTLRQQRLRQCKRIDNLRLCVCKYYNVERGCKHLSSYNQYCPNLHLCNHFVVGKCIYGGEKCRRSHNVQDPSVKWVLQSNNIDVSMPTDAVLEEIRRRLKLTDDSLSSDSESEEDLHQHLRQPSPFTTRSTLTPTACEFTPSKGTNLSTSKNNHNSNNKNSINKVSSNPSSLGHTPVTSKPHCNKINTFVFLDLEATGFHQSKITELSLVAVHRSSLEADPSIINKATHLPRIINKLTICINPGKPVERRAAELTGLNSSMLDKQGHFSNHTADLLLLFLCGLQAPCCLVAHSGRGFDFPLLQHEFSSINRHMPFDLYCLDSLVLFRSLCPESSAKKAPKSPSTDKTSTPSKALSITSPNGTPISITKPLDLEEATKVPKETLSKHLSSSLDKVETPKLECIDWWGCSDVEDNGHHHLLNNAHRDDKLSPNKLSSSTSNLTLHPSTSTEASHKTSKFKARTNWWDSEDEEEEDGLRAAKKHNGLNNMKSKVSMTTIVNGHEVLQSKSSDDFGASRNLSHHFGDVVDKKKVSYKLTEVHKRVTGDYPQQVHRAEDDSEALLRCFMFTPGALQWADHNAIPFHLSSDQLL